MPGCQQAGDIGDMQVKPKTLKRVHVEWIKCDINDLKHYPSTHPANITYGILRIFGATLENYTLVLGFQNYFQGKI